MSRTFLKPLRECSGQEVFTLAKYALRHELGNFQYYAVARDIIMDEEKINRYGLSRKQMSALCGFIKQNYDRIYRDVYIEEVDNLQYFGQN